MKVDVSSRRSILLAALALCSGCASRLNNEFTYEERFDSLAISAKGDILLVLGSEFDYVFRPPPELIAALHSDLRRTISASFSNFELDSPKAIKGEWRLHYVAKDSGDKGTSLARSLGFTSDGLDRYVLKGQIQGTRYLKNRVKEPAAAEKTNQTYTLRVSRSQAFAPREQIERSPVNFEKDGLVIIGLIILLPLILLLNGNKSL